MEPSEDRLSGDVELPAHLEDGLEPTSWPSATVAPMELSVSYPQAGACVIEIAGELDALTTPLLDECLREQLGAGPSHVVVDLTEVTFLGSSGLASLVQGRRELHAAAPGSALYLIGASHRAVRRPLELVGLLSLFTVHASQDEALAHIAAASSQPT